MTNIFLELELFLDPPVTGTGAMKEHLEREKIPEWNGKVNNDPKYKIFAAKARSYIAENCPHLERQGTAARNEKYAELESQAKTIIEVGVTEKRVKNLVSTFKTYFREDTIKKLVPLERSSLNQIEDEFVVPVCPGSLKCDKPVSYADMVKISNNLKEVGKEDLYDLLGVSQSNESEIPKKVDDLSKRVRDTPASDYTKDVLNRLHGWCTSLVKDKSFQKSYDVARKRFHFEEHAQRKLKFFVDDWVAKKKTDWKKYHAHIDEVKQLGYSQEESAWLVYEFFCHPSLKDDRRCPPPEKPKQRTRGSEHVELCDYLISLFTDSLDYHRSSNPRIKNKLQSVIDQINGIDDPDSVENELKRIIHEDLRKFWDSCKYDGIVTMPLFRVTTLARLPFPEFRDALRYFTP